MIISAMQNIARASVAGVLNCLPEGLLIMLSAWVLLHLIGRRNAGTRFAVWFFALLAIVALPFLSGLRVFSTVTSSLFADHTAPITFPGLWAIILFATWLVLVSVALLRIGAGVWQVRAIRSRCTDIDFAQLDTHLRETLYRFTERPVRLAVSDHLTMPAAFGFRKPTIVLPPWMLREYSAEQIRPILLHELAHVRRRDDWTNLLQKTLRAFFFFHPAVWWIDARLALEREMACDEAVLAATGNPRAYAACLVDLLEKSCARRGWTMAQAVVQGARQTTVRIAQILAAGEPTSTGIWRPAVVLVGCACLACCAILFCSPRLVNFGPDVFTRNTRPASIDLAAHIHPNHSLVPSPPHVLLAAFHPQESAAIRSAEGPTAVRRYSSRKPASFVRRAGHGRQRAVAPQMMLASAAKTTVDMHSPEPVLVIFTAATAENTSASRAVPAIHIEYVEMGRAQNGLPGAVEFKETFIAGHRMQFCGFIFIASEPEWQTFLPIQKSI